VADVDIPQVFEALGDLPFVEDAARPGESPRSWLRIHSYVRHGLHEQLLGDLDAQYEVLHDRAAAFHNENILRDDEPGDGSNAAFKYGEAFVYEHPDWQHHKREWLYHRAHARSDKVRRQALIEFVQVFLEAFWWWGDYVPSDFCDQLVSDLGQMTRSGPGKSWDGLKGLERNLRLLLNAYPLGSNKNEGPPEAWARVETALLEIERLCGLSRDAKPHTDMEHKVRGLLKVFLAHSVRYRDPKDARAAAYYRVAEEDFRHIGETWSVAWVLFERAELLYERDQIGDDLELEKLWNAAAKLAQPRSGSNDEADDEPDEEIIANLHRLRGDVCWKAQKWERAATWYRRAVLHAYVFHGSGGRADDRGPDEYTLQFYVDIRARAVNRLLELVRDGAYDLAVACAMAMGTQTETGAPAPEEKDLRSQLAAAIDDDPSTTVDPVRLAGTLFPRGPHVEELVRIGTDFTDFTEELNKRSARLDWAAFSKDLHDEQWP
jgi:hypothetical protein